MLAQALFYLCIVPQPFFSQHKSLMWQPLMQPAAYAACGKTIWVNCKAPTVSAISLKLQEEERERRMEYGPDRSDVDTEVIQVDPDTRDWRFNWEIMEEEKEDMDKQPNKTTSSLRVGERPWGVVVEVQMRAALSMSPLHCNERRRSGEDNSSAPPDAKGN